MPIIETRESIKNRLQQEAARQWAVDESDLKNGSFDPLVDLLLGAFSVESEKLWHEMESSRSRIIKRMVESMLPEVATGILPAHSVALIKPASENVVISSTDQFSTSGPSPVYLSSAGNFRLSGSVVQIIASGSQIDKISQIGQRESLAKLSGDISIPSGICWLGIEIPDFSDPGELVLFFNWNEAGERLKYLPYISSIRFVDGNQHIPQGQSPSYDTAQGIVPLEDLPESNDFLSNYEKKIRDYYRPYFVTISGLRKVTLRKFPQEWGDFFLDQTRTAALTKELYWVKLSCPASIPAAALTNLQIVANCVPVLNRKLIHQRGRLQPMFNVYGLKDESGFIQIQKVINGDGEPLSPVNQKELAKSQNVYSLRSKNIARYDKRDAFENLTSLAAQMRDDLAAFEAMDNSVLSSHLNILASSVNKMKEHLDTFEYTLPQLYILVKTKSMGSILDIHFWASMGSGANGLGPFLKLNAESANKFSSSTALLLLPTVGGRDSMDETQMQSAFKEAILTRGRAVTIEDFRTITKNLIGSAALNVEVRKTLGVGQTTKEGLRPFIEVKILPEPSLKQSEEFWLGQAQLVKNTLEQKSTRVLPLWISVHPYSWKV